MQNIIIPNVYYIEMKYAKRNNTNLTNELKVMGT